MLTETTRLSFSAERHLAENTRLSSYDVMMPNVQNFTTHENIKLYFWCNQALVRRGWSYVRVLIRARARPIAQVDRILFLLMTSYTVLRKYVQMLACFPLLQSLTVILILHQKMTLNMSFPISCFII